MWKWQYALSIFLVAACLGCGQDPGIHAPATAPYVPCKDLRILSIGACDVSWGCKNICAVVTEDGKDRFACEPIVGQPARVCGYDLEATN